MTDEIKPGDVVELKSGGPPLTVQWVANDDITGQLVACCTWFENKKRHEGTFPPLTLKKTE